MEKLYVFTLVTFTCYLAVSAAASEASLNDIQQKNYAPAPASDAPSCAPPIPTPTDSPGTCSFWSSHTSGFPDLITLFTTILELFGSSSSTTTTSAIASIYGTQMTVYQGLTNTRPDAYGALLRQSSAAILNSYTRRNYAYSPLEVKSAFRGALASQQSASVMAMKFENANRGYGRRN